MEAKKNLKRLKISELARLVNSTPLGGVIDEPGLRRLLIKGGHGIGDGSRYDLLRVAAWLVRMKKKEKSSDKKTRRAKSALPEGFIQEAAKNLSRAMDAERKREARSAGRDIGEIPPVKHPERREACRRDFVAFCKTYFPEEFYLPFSPDHFEVAKRIQEVVLRSGFYALACPRGFGKTTFCEKAVLWAILYGHRKFVLFVGSDEDAAGDSLEAIKSSVEDNDLVYEDFPEVARPVVALDGIVNRSASQLCCGELTHLKWSKKEIILPTIKGSAASGARVRIRGLTGNLRGRKVTLTDGSSVRPDLFIPDDPQTDESADSPEQCKKRIRLIKAALIGLAGPSKKISGLMPCTVIRKGDLADQFLDREKFPEWFGSRFKSLYKFPKRLNLWEKYAEIRRKELKEGNSSSPGATEFYRENREKMDAGAEVAWEERFDEGEISGLQHQMNLWVQDPEVYAAEYQNEPKDENASGQEENLTPDAIILRRNGQKRGVVPTETSVLTAHVDVHDDRLYYTIVALAPGFSGTVVDYGVHPGLKKSLRESGMEAEAAILSGLQFLDETVFRKTFYGPGGEYRVRRCLIDAGYVPKTVNAFIRSAPGIYVASRGSGVGADTIPISDKRRAPGETIGEEWRLYRKDGSQRLEFDANYWKTQARRRWLTPKGAKGAMMIFGEPAQSHGDYARHLALGEKSITIQGRSGRVVEVWKEIPNRENHWWDTLVGALVAGSLEGIGLEGRKTKVALHPRRARKSWSEIQRSKSF